LWDQMLSGCHRVLKEKHGGGGEDDDEDEETDQGAWGYYPCGPGSLILLVSSSVDLRPVADCQAIYGLETFQRAISQEGNSKIKLYASLLARPLESEIEGDISRIHSR
jgi:hypothetical protein